MKEVDKLKEFAMWMTGCGYDFTQHEYFQKNRHLLADNPTKTQEQEEAKKVVRDSTFITHYQKYSETDRTCEVRNKKLFTKKEAEKFISAITILCK